MKNPTPIIEQYFALFETRGLGLELMNNETGRNYKYNAIYSWNNPKMPNPAQDVYEFMVRYVLAFHGMSEGYDLIRHRY